MHTFTCNVCSAACRAEVLDRELPSCRKCGSNVRFRWIVHALSVEIFGESLPLKQFPACRTVQGLGLSDPLRIAKVLARRFDYRNTSYPREPQFDIMAPPPGAAFDFIVASEVFEHVQPPIQMAFNNLARLLKPNGFVVFSTPWESKGETVEHFPKLYDWQVVNLRSGAVLVNRTNNGRLETFVDPHFHEGPANILEMRVFSKRGLLACCEAAGFDEVSFA